ncbi:MAG: ABC transporter permease subunit [Chloroflexia bacterium]
MARPTGSKKPAGGRHRNRRPDLGAFLTLPKPVLLSLALMVLTALLSLLYAVSCWAGSPLRLQVTGAVQDIAVSPGAPLLAAAVRDGTARLWDTNDWTMRTLPGPGSPVLRVGFTPDGRTLLGVCEDGTILFWDVASGRITRALPEGEPVRDASLSADGRVLAVLGASGVVRLWDVGWGAVMREVAAGGGHRGAVALNADGTLLAIGEGNRILIQEVEGSRPPQVLQGYWRNAATQEGWEGHRGAVIALAFSPDGRLLASGGSDTLLIFWNLEDGMVAGTTEAHWAPVVRVAFNQDGTSFLSGSQDAKALNGRPASQTVINYEGHLGTVTGVAFGHEPTILYTAGDDGTVRSWETVNRSQTHMVWTRVGLAPLWGDIVTWWMFGSGLLGLFFAWAMARMRGWGHLLAISLYLLGILILLVPILTAFLLPLGGIRSYTLPWDLGLQVTWPLIVVAAWYGGEIMLLMREPVALCYEAPHGLPLAQQLMAVRRTQRLRFGIFVAAVWLTIILVLYSILKGFNLNVPFMGHFFEFIMEGAGITLWLSAASISLAVVLALIGALGRLSHNPVLNGIAGFYVSLIRGTPLLVQLYIWYLGLPRLNITLPAELAGVLALGVNYGAYMTEIFRAGIQAIGKGQHEAAQALGMTATQTFRRIVLPQAFRIVIPPIGNEFIAMMKDSALVSVFSVWELTYRAQKIGRQYFRSIETFMIAAAFYWVLTVVFQFLQGKLEEYMARSERR